MKKARLIAKKQLYAMKVGDRFIAYKSDYNPATFRVYRHELEKYYNIIIEIKTLEEGVEITRVK